MSGKNRAGARHKARARAVDILFEAEARGIGLPELLEERIALALASGPGDGVKPVSEYAALVVRGVAAERARIDGAISENLTDWTLERLPAVDRAVLRIAVWELLYTDVPPVVAVNEAVELTKQLSTDDSPSFVNGVLGQLVDLAPQIRAAAAAVAVPRVGSTDAAATADAAGPADRADAPGGAG